MHEHDKIHNFDNMFIRSAFMKIKSVFVVVELVLLQLRILLLLLKINLMISMEVSNLAPMVWKMLMQGNLLLQQMMVQLEFTE